MPGFHAQGLASPPPAPAIKECQAKPPAEKEEVTQGAFILEPCRFLAFLQYLCGGVTVGEYLNHEENGGVSQANGRQ